MLEFNGIKIFRLDEISNRVDVQVLVPDISGIEQLYYLSEDILSSPIQMIHQLKFRDNDISTHKFIMNEFRTMVKNYLAEEYIPKLDVTQLHRLTHSAPLEHNTFIVDIYEEKLFIMVNLESLKFYVSDTHWGLVNTAPNKMKVYKYAKRPYKPYLEAHSLSSIAPPPLRHEMPDNPFNYELPDLTGIYTNPFITPTTGGNTR